LHSGEDFRLPEKSLIIFGQFQAPHFFEQSQALHFCRVLAETISDISVWLSDTDKKKDHTACCGHKTIAKTKVQTG
jgi:hypothetical protein